VIRNVVVHISNEQPLLADLFDLPASSDAGLLCTNLRSIDGKRPVFIDQVESTFFFPYRAIRFLEIPTGALQRHAAEGGRAAPTAQPAAGDLPADEADAVLPAVLEVGPGSGGAPPESDLGDEIDEDFLRRIREV
jgi:hypothetical protein